MQPRLSSVEQSHWPEEDLETRVCHPLESPLRERERATYYNVYVSVNCAQKGEENQGIG